MKHTYRVTAARLSAEFVMDGAFVTSADTAFIWAVGYTLEGLKQWAERRGGIIELVSSEADKLPSQLQLSFAADAVVNADAVKGRERGAKRVYVVESAEQTQERIDAAIQEGRHSTESSVVCQFCRNDIPCFYHKTLDNKWICKACAIRIGVVSDDSGRIPAAF